MTASIGFLLEGHYSRNVDIIFWKHENSICPYCWNRL